MKKIKKSELAMTVLEREWNSNVKLINVKIEAAAQLLKEANDIAQEKNMPKLRGYSGSYNSEGHEMDQAEIDRLLKVSDDISFPPLFKELKAAGWHTSFMRC